MTLEQLTKAQTLLTAYQCSDRAGVNEASRALAAEFRTLTGRHPSDVAMAELDTEQPSRWAKVRKVA